MNSEKVKEIKKGAMWGDVLNKIGYYQKRFKYTKEINVLIRLINEFESENEKLKQHKRELQGGQQDLIKRIAELEKEIKENAFYSKGYAQGIKNTYEVVVPDKLKQFAERLKEKVIRPCDLYDCVTLADIDETLKEFING